MQQQQHSYNSASMHHHHRHHQSHSLSLSKTSHHPPPSSPSPSPSPLRRRRAHKWGRTHAPSDQWRQRLLASCTQRSKTQRAVGLDERRRMRLRIVAEAAEDERAALLAFVEQLEAAEMQQTEEQLLAMAAEAGMDNVGAWRCGGDGEEGDDDIEELVQFQQYMAEQQLQDDAQQHQQQMHGMTEMVLCPVCCNACLTVRDISGDDNDDDEFYGQNKDTQPDIDEDLDSTNMHQQQKQQRQRQRVVTCDNGCGIILNTSWYQHQSDKNHQQSCTSDDSLCDTPPDCSHGNDEVHARPILQQVRHRLDTVMSAHQAVCPHTLTFVATITTVDDADDANGIIESSNTNNDMDMVDMMTSGQDQQQQRGRKSRSPTPPCALWAQCQRCQQRCRVL